MQNSAFGYKISYPATNLINFFFRDQRQHPKKFDFPKFEQILQKSLLPPNPANPPIINAYSTEFWLPVNFSPKINKF